MWASLKKNASNAIWCLNALCKNVDCQNKRHIHATEDTFFRTIIRTMTQELYLNRIWKKEKRHSNICHRIMLSESMCNVDKPSFSFLNKRIARRVASFILQSFPCHVLSFRSSLFMCLTPPSPIPPPQPPHTWTKAHPLAFMSKAAFESMLGPTALIKSFLATSLHA